MPPEFKPLHSPFARKVDKEVLVQAEAGQSCVCACPTVLCAVSLSFMIRNVCVCNTEHTLTQVSTCSQWHTHKHVYTHTHVHTQRCTHMYTHMLM